MKLLIPVMCTICWLEVQIVEHLRQIKGRRMLVFH